MMLASRGDVSDLPSLQARGYLFDLKIDGIRCVVRIEQGQVTMKTRGGESCAVRYPEVAGPLADLYPEGRWEFDGELAVNDERGLPSWPLTHKRNSAGRRRIGAQQQAIFYGFDVLVRDGVDLRNTAFSWRRRALTDTLPTTAATIPVLHGADAEAMWAVVESLELEGLVAKRATSTYREGRHADWVKVKRTSTASCLVGGFDPGTGSRAATFGALHLYLLDAGELVPVGKVGSGFSDRELSQVMQLMRHPPLIVEVEFLDVSPDGQLRQPVFLRVRQDQGIDDCTIAQLA